LLLKVTAAPPDGAGPFRVTVPVDRVPPLTLVGLTLSVLREGGNTVSTAFCVVPPAPAVMATLVDASTADV